VDEEEHRFGADVMREPLGRLAPTCHVREGDGQSEDGRIRHGGYAGSTMTTAVQL
jgi:hypothetical protein